MTTPPASSPAPAPPLAELPRRCLERELFSGRNTCGECRWSRCSDVSMPLHRRNSTGQPVEDTQYLEEITEAAEPEDTDRLHEITCSAPKVGTDIMLSHTLFKWLLICPTIVIVNRNRKMV